MIIRHVAQKGKNAGTFVPCQAKIKCRNQGTHITPTTYKDVKKAYGEVTMKTYAEALTKGLIVNTAPAFKTLPVQIPFFGEGATQEEFDDFLTKNGVRAKYDVRTFNAQHELVFTGEQESLYRVESMREFSPILENTTAYTSPAAAERASLQTIISVKQSELSYSVSNKDLKNIARLAATPNLTSVTKTRLEELTNILEDYNFHTFNAYITAVTNNTKR